MAIMPANFFKKCPAPQSPASLFIVLGLCTVGLIAPKTLPIIPVLMALLWAPFWRDAFQTAQNRVLLFSLLGFMAWALASCFWSPDMAFSLEKWGKSFALILFVFVFLSLCRRLRLDPETFKKTTIGAAILLTGMMVFLTFEYHFQYAITRFVLGIEDGAIPKSMTSGFLFNRSSVFAILMIVPVGLMIATSNLPRLKKRHLTALMVTSGVALSMVAQSQTAGIAFLLIVLSLAYPIHKKAAQKLFTIAVCGLILIAPFVAGPTYQGVQKIPAFEKRNSWLYQASAIHRLEVWNFLSEKIADKPAFGHGMESTRFLRSDSWMPHMKSDRVMHPHNLALQLWLEFGFVGVVLFLSFFVFLCRKIFTLPPVPQRAAFAQMVSLLGVLAVGYGLWQAWQIGMISVLAALILMAAQQSSLNQKQS